MWHVFRNKSCILCTPFYVLYACLKILSLCYLLLSSFPNTETFGVRGGEKEKDNDRVIISRRKSTSVCYYHQFLLDFAQQNLSVQITERSGENWCTNSSTLGILASVFPASNYFSAQKNNCRCNYVMYGLVKAVWPPFKFCQLKVCAGQQVIFHECALCKAKLIRSVSGISITITTSTVSTQKI